MLLYDELDEDVLRCYHEISLANLLFFSLKEGACSEQSSRMTAMDAASKNAGREGYRHFDTVLQHHCSPLSLTHTRAGEMIDALTLTYNRKRQSVITTALIEVISGAAAV